MSVATSPVTAAIEAGRPRIVRYHLVIFAALFIFLLVAPYLFSTVFVMKVLCYALFVSAFNLLLGFGGLLSFGHAAFFGAASYICAYSAKTWGFSPELAVLTGALAAAILGAAIGSLAIRRQGIYFAMVTLAFAQMVYFVCLQAPFTGGEDGIQAVPRGRLFGVLDLSGDHALYYFVFGLVFIGLLFIYRVVHSPFGQVLKAVRQNEPRAVSLGYRVNRYKLGVFVLSATLAGVAGALKALVFQLASLEDVYWTTSGEVILMTLLGGMGTIFGPIVGAAVIVAMQNYLVTLGDKIIAIQGIIFMLAVLLFREGVVGLLARWLKKPL